MSRILNIPVSHESEFFWREKHRLRLVLIVGIVVAIHEPVFVGEKSQVCRTTVKEMNICQEWRAVIIQNDRSWSNVVRIQADGMQFGKTFEDVKDEFRCDLQDMTEVLFHPITELKFLLWLMLVML